MPRPRLAILVSFSGQGGVERMIANLSSALVRHDLTVDILLIKSKGPFVAKLPSEARLIRLRAGHSATCVPEVAHYLRTERPDAMLAVKHRGIIAAVRARRLAGTSTLLGGRLGTTVSAALADSSAWRRRRWHSAMQRFYPQLQTVIAVSEGVASDINAITGLAAPQLRVIRNPVITRSMLQSAEVTVEHPALSDPGIPIILGAGRLTRQKDFATLLDAFALVQKQRPAQLVILGDGGDREQLLAQARQLGIEDRVLLPGFQENPWTWMRASQVFVLSSRWEGSPNSLSEALALGVPVVSTDCPSGPRELLKGGSVAPLVAMDDCQAMAEAIETVLDNPPSAATLKSAVAEYHADISANAYLRALQIETGS